MRRKYKSNRVMPKNRRDAKRKKTASREYAHPQAVWAAVIANAKIGERRNALGQQMFSFFFFDISNDNTTWTRWHNEGTEKETDCARPDRPRVAHRPRSDHQCAEQQGVFVRLRRVQKRPAAASDQTATLCASLSGARRLGLSRTRAACAGSRRALCFAPPRAAPVFNEHGDRHGGDVRAAAAAIDIRSGGRH